MAGKFRNFLTLLRVRQYYKNGLVFVALFFSENLLNFSYYLPFLLGFIVLCCASSINYIINDWRDIEDDKKHPEKIHKKPLASGTISITMALILIIVLGGVILLSLLFLIPNWGFIIMVILLMVTGQLYNHLLKKYAFIDVITLSLGYLWRSMAGAFLIAIQISPWLFLAIFEIAMFLSLAKRKGDLMILGEKDTAIEHKEVYNIYNDKLLDQFYTMMGASLFITYALYLIFNFGLIETSQVYTLDEYMAILSIPIFLYIIMRYIYLTTAKPKIARNPERAFFDKGMLIAIAIFFAVLAYIYYIDEIIALITGTP